jgi:hypothetical protein
MESDDFDPEHDVRNEDLYLVPDPGDEEEGGGEKEDHQGRRGLTLPHTCTEKYLFSSQTFFTEIIHGYTSLKLQQTNFSMNKKSLAKNAVSKAKHCCRSES